jgi:hypothetical protein
MIRLKKKIPNRSNKTTRLNANCPALSQSKGFLFGI